MSAGDYLYIKDMVKNVADLLWAVPRLKQLQHDNTLTESIPETPMIQVYFENMEIAGAGSTDRTSFGGKLQAPVRETKVTINIDLYTRQRSNIGTDMASIHRYVDEVVKVLEAQNISPFFNLKGVGSFRWRVERAEFDYNNVKYVGLRYVLTLGVL